jgi:hypothetical protein
VLLPLLEAEPEDACAFVIIAETYNESRLIPIIKNKDRNTAL